MGAETQQDLELIEIDIEAASAVAANVIDNSKLIYRSPNGSRIDRNTWLAHLSDLNNGTKQTVIVHNGYDVTINKIYVGNIDKLYITNIECSEDLTKWIGYYHAFAGNTSAENDYNRLVVSVGLNEDVSDETVISPTNGGVALFFDFRYNLYIVNLLTASEAWKYPTRAMAQAKFDELTAV